MGKVKTTLTRWWTEWIRSVLLIVLLITSFRSAVADWNDVPSGSMKPTIFEGDRIVVNKLAYDLKMAEKALGKMLEKEITPYAPAHVDESSGIAA